MNEITGKELILKVRPKFEKFVKEKFSSYPSFVDKIELLCKESDVGFIHCIELIKQVSLQATIDKYVKDSKIDLKTINQDDFKKMMEYLNFFVEIYG
jgi:hypothetical protein